MSLSLDDHRSDKGLAKWFAQINAADAPVPRNGLRTALQFFAQHMPTLPPQMAMNFILGMDLSRPVRAVMLTKKDDIIAYRTGNESPFKLFYSRVGASRHSLGINPANRRIVRFRPRVPTPALESYSTGAIDVWTIPANGQPSTVAPRSNSTGFIATGGSTQLVIPRSVERLEVVS